MTGKLTTNLTALDNCAKKVNELAAKADGLKGKLTTAEVPENSWGLLGLAVAHFYRPMVADLRDFLTAMAEGAKHAGDRLAESATAYREADEAAQQEARKLKAKLGGAR